MLTCFSLTLAQGFCSPKRKLKGSGMSFLVTDFTLEILGSNYGIVQCWPWGWEGLRISAYLVMKKKKQTEEAPFARLTQLRKTTTEVWLVSSILKVLLSFSNCMMRKPYKPKQRRELLFRTSYGPSHHSFEVFMCQLWSVAKVLVGRYSRLHRETIWTEMYNQKLTKWKSKAGAWKLWLEWNLQPLCSTFYVLMFDFPWLIFILCL